MNEGIERNFMRERGKSARKTILKTAMKVGGSKFAQKIKEELKATNIVIRG